MGSAISCWCPVFATEYIGRVSGAETPRHHIDLHLMCVDVAAWHDTDTNITEKQIIKNKKKKKKKRWSKSRTVGSQEPGSVRVRNNRNFRGETHSLKATKKGWLWWPGNELAVTTLSILVISSAVSLSTFSRGFGFVCVCVLPFQLVRFAIHKTAVQKWQVVVVLRALQSTHGWTAPQTIFQSINGISEREVAVNYGENT